MAGTSSRMSILPDGLKLCMHQDESVTRGELAQASKGDPCVLARGSYVVPVDVIVSVHVKRTKTSVRSDY